MTRILKIQEIILLLLFCGAFLRAEDISVNAKLTPERIVLGQAAKLQITVNGGQKVNKIQTPSVPNLQIEHVSEMSNFQFINGVISSSATHIYTVVPTSTGNFKIPPMEVTVNGEVYKTPAFSLQVVHSSAPSAVTPGANPQSSPLPPQQQQQGTDAPARLAFLVIQVPKKEVYVGEKVPIEVKAYFQPGQQVSLNSLPMITSDAFTIAGITEKYDQSNEVANGRNYTALTWHASMDAIKEGEYTVEGKLNCTVMMNRQPAFRHSRSLFDDFFSILEQKPLTLLAQPQKLKILPLPEQGKPVDFAGAVGQFQIRASAQPTKLNAGDPVTLTMVVAGKGNFDRLSAPKLASEEGLKTYTPTAKFEPEDSTGFEGRKIFEQAIIPQKTGVVPLPAVELRYFDPEAKQYKMASTASITLQIEATPISAAQAPAAKAANLPAQNLSQNESELAPNKIEMNALTANMRPLILRGWFVATEMGLLLVFVVLTILTMRKERLMRDPRYLRGTAACRAIRLQLEQMENAQKRSDAAAFFASARKILQQRLAEIWMLKPDTITVADLETRLPHHHRLREIFEIADSVAYADGSAHTYSLVEWKASVMQELQGLEMKK